MAFLFETAITPDELRQHHRQVERGTSALVSMRDEVALAERHEQTRDVARSADIGKLHSELTAANELSERALSATEGVGAAIDAVGDDIRAGFSALSKSLDAGFEGLERAVADAAAQLSAQLQSVEIKSGWSDTYKRFVSFKKNALELAKRRDYARALEQALAGLSLVDPGGVADDNVLRDPELNALVAMLLVDGLVEPPKESELTPVVFCERAVQKGGLSEDPTERQAAADAAHRMAIIVRATGGSFDNAAKIEEGSYLLEQRNKVGALARALAAFAVAPATPPAQVAAAVALASIVHPRFAATWLAQPALLAAPDRVGQIVEAARARLVEQHAEVKRLLAAQVGHWRTMLGATMPDAELPQFHDVGGLGENESIVRIAAVVRKGVEDVTNNDAGIVRWLTAHARRFLDMGEVVAREMHAAVNREFHEAASVNSESDKKWQSFSQWARGCSFMGIPALWAALALYFVVATPRSCGQSSATSLWVTLAVTVVLVGVLILARHVRTGDVRKRTTDAEQRSAHPTAKLEALAATLPPLHRALGDVPSDGGLQSWLARNRNPMAQMFVLAASNDVQVSDVIELGKRMEATMTFWTSTARETRVEGFRALAVATNTCRAAALDTGWQLGAERLSGGSGVQQGGMARR